MWDAIIDNDSPGYEAFGYISNSWCLTGPCCTTVNHWYEMSFISESFLFLNFRVIFFSPDPDHTFYWIPSYVFLSIGCNVFIGIVGIQQKKGSVSWPILLMKYWTNVQITEVVIAHRNIIMYMEGLYLHPLFVTQQSELKKIHKSIKPIYVLHMYVTMYSTGVTRITFKHRTFVQPAPHLMPIVSLRIPIK